MAFRGKKISNGFNKQSIEFITTAKDSGGKLLEMISVWEPSGGKPVAHYHPNQDEYFTVLEGELSVMVNERCVILSRGESLQISRGVVHAMWNGGSDRVVAEWKVYPALKTEHLLEVSMGLVEDGMVGSEGTPDVLTSAALLRRYKREFRLRRPAYWLQWVIFGLLGLIASFRGKRALLSKYIS